MVRITGAMPRPEIAEPLGLEPLWSEFLVPAAQRVPGRTCSTVAGAACRRCGLSPVRPVTSAACHQCGLSPRTPLVTAAVFGSTRPTF